MSLVSGEWEIVFDAAAALARCDNPPWPQTWAGSGGLDGLADLDTTLDLGAALGRLVSGSEPHKNGSRSTSNR